jgi:hypothetical protein
MSKKPPQITRVTHPYNDLKNEWYEKLKEEGFSDIEENHENQSKAFLKTWDSHSFKVKCKPHAKSDDIDPEIFIQKQDYYLNAYQFLMGGVFESDVEKEIWRIHSEGYGIREIVKKLAQTHVDILYSRDKVWRVLKRLKKSMQHFTKKRTPSED